MDAVHFYVDAIVFGVAILHLIPIYRDIGRKFFVVLLAVLLICLVGASFVITRQHQKKVEKTEQHIIISLRERQKTFDELAHSLDYNEIGQLSEALETMLAAATPPISYDDVKLTNCDGSIIAEVRRYYVRSDIK
jgi:hypothetical protein